MCGILAQTSHNSPVDTTQFRQGLAMLRSRGPDGDGVWQSRNKKTTIGHTRLALTGPNNGRQPVSNEDNTIIASVNGEFYGYQGIRANLESRGHTFRTESDSEILVHLYEQYGEQFVKHLRGEFAFVLWDDTRQTLWAGRDRFGIKPLNYSLSQDQLTIGSEAKSILKTGLQARWNHQALYQALTHQYQAPQETFFDGIKQIPPAHLLCYRNQKISLTRYWSPPEHISHYPDEESCIEEIRTTLKESVKERLHPSAAVSLSGGIDSSGIAAIASKTQTHSVPCFSISFDESGYDEIDLVSESAGEIGANLHRVNVTRTDQFNYLSEAVYQSEGLAINGQLVGKYRLNQAIRQAGHQVVISGEGADEAFLGYAHILADHSDANILNHPLQAGIMLPSENHQLSSPRPEWLSKWPSFLRAKMAFCENMQGLLDSDFRNAMLQQDRLKQTLDDLHTSQQSTMRSEPAMQSAYLWTRLALSNYILRTLGDGAEMPHSIEGRVPFLDHILFEKAWSLPVEAKIQGSTTKSILRKALAPLLPAKITHREKHPFLAPPLLSDQKLTHCLRDLINSSLLESTPFIDTRRVRSWFESMIDRPPSEQRATDPILMMILSCIHLNNRYQMIL